MTNIFYFSNKSKPCAVILQNLETIPHIRSLFQYVCVDNVAPSHNISGVPAIVLENKVYCGKAVFQWLDSEKQNNTHPPFEVGFGNNNFSSLSNSEAPCENNHNFTYINEESTQSSQSQSNVNDKISKTSNTELDDLISQRKLDLPPPKSRA